MKNYFITDKIKDTQAPLIINEEKINFIKNETQLLQIFKYLKLNQVKYVIIDGNLKWDKKNSIDILIEILRNNFLPHSIYIFANNILDKLIKQICDYQILSLSILNKCSIFYLNKNMKLKNVFNELFSFYLLKDEVIKKFKNILIVNNNTILINNKFDNYFIIKNIESFNNVFKNLHCNDFMQINCHVIIYVHLNWEAQDLDKNVGLEMAYNIRVWGFSFPIILISPLLLKTIFLTEKKVNNIFKNILLAPKTYFIKLKNNEIENSIYLNKLDLTPISKACMIDLQTGLLNKQSFIMEKINHNLLNIHNVNIQKINIVLADFPILLPSLNIDFFKNNLLQNLYNEIQYKQTLTELIAEIKALFNNNSIHLFNPTKKTKPLIMIVDDELDEPFLKQLILKLNTFFNVKSVQTSLKAMQILKKDYNNNIKAIIVDWRLYNNNNNINNWQTYQGYDLLEYANKQGNRVLITLTGQDNDLVYKIRNQQSIFYKIYKKETLHNHIDLFIQQLINDIEFTTNDVEGVNVPDGIMWNKTDNFGNSFHKIYTQLLVNNQFKSINIKVELIVHNIINELIDNILFDLEKSNYMNFKAIKNTDLFPSLATRKKGNLTTQDLQNLLVYRRCILYIYFYLYKKMPTLPNELLELKTFSIIYNELTYNKLKMDFTIKNKKHLLCFKGDIITSPLLYEEIQWLRLKKIRK